MAGLSAAVPFAEEAGTDTARPLPMVVLPRLKRLCNNALMIVSIVAGDLGADERDLSGSEIVVADKSISWAWSGSDR